MNDDLDLRAVHQRHEPDPEFRTALRGLVTQIVAPDRSARADPQASVVEVFPPKLGSRRTPRRRLGYAFLVAVAAAAVIAIAVVTIPSDETKVRPDESTVGSGESTIPSTLPAPGGPAFAAAVEAAGLLTSPSADEVARAMDGNLFKPYTGPLEVSAAGNYVSLRTCHQDFTSPCSSGWAYVTGNVDGSDAEVHRGLLGLAGRLSLDLVADRYFVAMSTDLSNAQAPTAWLIDAVSGKAGPLSWREEPATLGSPQQALMLEPGEGNGRAAAVVPTVVDARDGTIRPMAMADGIVGAFSVAQHLSSRVWWGTGAEGGRLGLAYTDDGGATWTEVALPERLRSRSEDMVIAADGNHVAVTSGWLPEGMGLYVSDDAGRTWTTTTTPPSETAEANIAHLYVLAHGRLALAWFMDAHLQKVFVSTSSDWDALGAVDVPYVYFGVNQAGIAFGESRSLVPNDAQLYPVTTDFSTDLKTWRAIEGLDH